MIARNFLPSPSISLRGLNAALLVAPCLRATNPRSRQSRNQVDPACLPAVGTGASWLRGPRSSALGGQQRPGDGCPFHRKITGCRRAACLPIPITGIVEIALNAVQVSVNPCAVRAFAVGDNLVGFIPIAANAGKSPSGGFLLARLCLKSDGVMIGFWRKPRLSVDRSRTCRTYHLVLRPSMEVTSCRSHNQKLLRVESYQLLTSPACMALPLIAAPSRGSYDLLARIRVSSTSRGNVRKVGIALT